MSLLNRNRNQSDQQTRVQNFGAGEEFLDRYLKYEAIHLALEAVDEIIASQQSGEEAQGMSEEDKTRITQALSKSLEGKVAVESVNEDLVNQIIVDVQGEVEKPEKPNAWDIVQSIACEAVGINEDTEKPTQEQMDDYRNVLSQMTHAFGWLSDSEKGAELAFESVDEENGDQLLRTCTFINDQLTHNGVDDDDIAIEYAMNAPIVGDADENGDIAVEKVQIKFVGGKKTVVKKRKKKIKGAALAAMKRAGRIAGKKPKSAATRKLIAKSLRKRHKAGK
ncbi:hypothetical protein KAR91_55725 [Candidatus Pacearchaeota archaeon]|nr:hypothetical protein [Candidatus Pacearchaeota archaeon]